MSDLSVSASANAVVGLEPEKAPKEAAAKNAEVENKVIEKPAKANIDAKPAEKEAEHEEVEVAVEDMNAFMQSMQRNLSFTIDEQLGQEIISVTDAETNEVIRQIPSEELVVLRKKMDDVVGILFDTKV